MLSDRIKGGVERAPHRSLLRAVGVKDVDFAKPFVGIINSYSEIVPGHIHLRSLVRHIKKGVIDGGGVPFEVNTIAVDDGLAMGHEGMRYSLPSREVIADSVEIVAEAHAFDGLVLLSNCDKITPGMLMGAARLDRPTILFTGGPMRAGRLHESKVGLIDVFEAVGKYKKGEISFKELLELETAACPGPGSCSGLFTANTMAILSESMGLSLPYSATASALSARRRRLAYETGQRAVGLIRETANFKTMLSRDSFENAIMVDMALGGSTNSVMHLLAIAREAGVDLKLDDFDRLGRKVPHIAPIYPGGRFMVEDLHRAGGVPALMKQLADRIHLDAYTVSGWRIADIVSQARVRDPSVIRDVNSPLRPEGGLVVLRGTLAPGGALMKTAALQNRDYAFEGRAKVYDGEEAAYAAITDGSVEKGTVVVIRYEGPAGGPGMREMLGPTSAIVGMNLDRYVALVSDGRFSGGTRGPAIGHVSPEAATGGPIALVKDGDPIRIAVPERRLDLLIEQEELEERKRNWTPRRPNTSSPLLLRYASLVESASEGCVLRRDGDGKHIC